MNKKILVLSASPRKGGNSDLLCDSFIQGAEQVGHQVEKVFLRDKKISYCIDCGLCVKNEHSGCSQQDDMTGILDSILQADVIVMATPVYFYTMNGQMKTLIDRCCAKYTKITNKDFYFIMTAADERQSMLKRTHEEFRAFLDCLDYVEEKGCIQATGVWQKGDVNSTEFINTARSMGISI